MEDLNYFFDLARKEASHYPFEELQEAFTKRLAVQPRFKKHHFFKFSKLFLMTILFFLALFQFSPNESAKSHIVGQPTAKIIGQQKHTHRLHVKKSVPDANSPARTKPKAVVGPFKIPFLNDLVQRQQLYFVSSIPEVKQIGYASYFPSFTEAEIAQNNKRKKELVRAAFKLDRKQFANLYEQGFGFAIQKTEISNLAYRTFLIDLAVQNERDKYELAKPDLDLWTQLPNGEANQLKAHYFSHPAFENYPVLTISRIGAELYCEWLSAEVQKLAELKKAPSLLVRLPTREEWVAAASNNGAHSPYAWNGIYLRDYRGLYLANLNTWSTEPFKIEEDGGMYSVPVTYYSTNALGLYNMCGNAAEMVYEDLISKTPGTAGGSWMSSPDEIKINAADPYAGITEPSPYIGFRVILIQTSTPYH
ncbi:MAG: hypothetical protein RLZZ211_2186 [Bacteroidota bacterium]|jgi:formylglycine-generating enzyme required for sulfatase activity